MSGLKPVAQSINLASYVQSMGTAASRYGYDAWRQLCPEKAAPMPANTAKWGRDLLMQHALVGALVMGGEISADPLSNLAHCVQLGLANDVCPSSRLGDLGLGTLRASLMVRRYTVGTVLCGLGYIVGIGRRSPFFDALRVEQMMDLENSSQSLAVWEYGILGLPEAWLTARAEAAHGGGHTTWAGLPWAAAIACNIVLQPFRLALSVLLVGTDASFAVSGALAGVVIGTARIGYGLSVGHREPPAKMLQTCSLIVQKVDFFDQSTQLKAALLPEYTDKMVAFAESAQYVRRTAGLAPIQECGHHSKELQHFQHSLIDQGTYLTSTDLFPSIHAPERRKRAWFTADLYQKKLAQYRGHLDFNLVSQAVISLQTGHPSRLGRLDRTALYSALDDIELMLEKAGVSLDDSQFDAVGASQSSTALTHGWLNALRTAWLRGAGVDEADLTFA